MSFFNQEPDINIKVMIGGKIKVGKTWLCGDISHLDGFGPMLLVDTHKGSNWVRGRFYPGSEIVRVTSNVGLSRAIDMLLDAKKSKDGLPFKTIVIDTISDVWKRAMAGYDEKLLEEIDETSDRDSMDLDRIPMQAWGPIKGAYNRVLTKILLLDVNVILLGWEGDIFNKKGPTGATKTKTEKGTEALIDASLNMVLSGSRRTFNVYYDRTGLFKNNMEVNPDIFLKMREKLIETASNLSNPVLKALSDDDKKKKKKKTEEKAKIDEDEILCESCMTVITQSVAQKTKDECGKSVCWKCMAKEL